MDKEYDDGRLHYDVEFYSGNKEYDYEIAAKDGSILSVDMDIENYSIPSVDTSDSSKNYIGIENAKQTALSKAGLSSSSVHWEKASWIMTTAEQNMSWNFTAVTGNTNVPLTQSAAMS